MNKRSILPLTALCLTLTAQPFSVRAADVIKADNANNLDLGTSWLGGVPPTVADVGVWNNTVTVANTTLLGSTQSWAGIKILNPADLVTISAGNALTNGAAGIDMNLATTNLTLANVVILGAGQTWNVGSGRTLTVSGVVGGAGPLTKEGAGTALVSGANTYTGGTVNNAGVLQINSGTGIGATAGGLTNNNGATVRINTATSIANPVNFNGTVTIDLNNFANNAAFTGSWSGNGTVNFVNQDATAVRTFTMGGSSANWNNLSGTVNMGTNTGVFRFNDGGGNGNLGSANAVIDLGTGSATFLSRNLAAPANLGAVSGGPNTKITAGSNGNGTYNYSIGGKNLLTTFSGTILDATTARLMGITKVGTNKWILDGTNTYSGLTTISSGTLQVGSGGTSGTLGIGPIVNNAALLYNRSGAITLSNAISGSGVLTLQGGVVATFEGTNTSSGTLAVGAGAADVGAAGSIQCSISLGAGTYLIVTNNPTFTLNQTLSGVGTVDGGLTAIGGTISPAGTAAGGTLTFLNNLTNSGPVTYQMELATAGASDLVNVTGDFTVTSTNSIIASKLGGGTLALGTYPLINYTGNFIGGLTNFTVTISGVTGTLTNPPNQIALMVTPGVRGATNLTWVGDGAANYWDANLSTNWVNGSAQFKFLAGDSVRFDATGSANPTVNLNSAILQPASVVVAAASDYTFSGIGNISGSTGLTKSNAGALFVLVTNNYTGPTLVSGGVLDIASVANGNSASAIGAATSDPTNLVLNSAALRYSGSGGSTDRGATLNGAVGVLDVTTANLTFNGSPIVGAAALAKSGAGTLTLSVPNTYAGGTVLSNGVLALGANIANNNGTGGSALGATNNPVTFRGGALELFGFTGSEAANYSTLYNPLIVPAGEVGELRMFQRGPVNSGGNAGLQSSLTGAGTLNLVVNYVRDDLSGDWSAFTGLINVLARDGGDEMRVNNNFGYSNATINLNDNVSLCRSFTANTVNDIGALNGTSLAVLGNGNSSGSNTTWRVGWLNTMDDFAGTIAEGAGTTVIKIGTGKWNLSGADLAGNTVVSNGILSVSGSFGGANIRVASGAFLDVTPTVVLPLSFGQTLGGNGTVWGSVDTAGGGTIAPGFSLGTLTVTNSVNLGGVALMEVNRNGGLPLADKLVAPAITMGGTLQVVNAGAPLQIGDTFDLFDGALSGGFTTFILGYYTWNTSQLAVNGTISVTGFLPHPTLAMTYDGVNATLTSTGGVPGGSLAVVTSTNAAAPLDTWTVVEAGVYDPSGNYTTFILVDPAAPQRYYAIRAQ